MKGDKKYLGDGVYVDLKYGQIHLTTGCESDADQNTIVLEREVYEALVVYAERLKKEKKI